MVAVRVYPVSRCLTFFKVMTWVNVDDRDRLIVYFDSLFY